MLPLEMCIRNLFWSSPHLSSLPKTKQMQYFQRIPQQWHLQVILLINATFQLLACSGSPTPFKEIGRSRWEKTKHQSETETSCLVPNSFQNWSPLRQWTQFSHQHRNIYCHLNCPTDLPSWQMLFQLSHGCVPQSHRDVSGIKRSRSDTMFR